MKFASSLKFALSSLLAGIFALALTGCGGTSNLALTQGNWAVTATSTAAAKGSLVAFVVGGNLTQSGSSVSGTMHVTESLCFDPSQTIAFTGTVHEKKVTLTSATIEGLGVINVTASGTKDSLTGTYTITGGECDGDSGTVSAGPVPSISGTWNGSIANVARAKGDGVAEATISVALTQAATASEDGTFELTGTITYTNSVCSVSGTITSATLAGNFIIAMNATTLDTDDGEGSFSYTNVLVDSPTAPTSMSGLYDVTFGQCADQNQTLTLTKQ